MSKLRLEVLNEENADLSNSNIVLTDGHREFLGVYIYKHGSKIPKKYVEHVRLSRCQSSLVYEARAIANGIRIAARQCGRGPIVLANDNTDMVRYAKKYLSEDNEGATSVLRYDFTENDIKIVNGYLEGVRKIAEKRPIVWAEITNSSENDNVAHNLCMEAQKRKNNRMRSMS
jgi:hypothetical protein